MQSAIGRRISYGDMANIRQSGTVIDYEATRAISLASIARGDPEHGVKYIVIFDDLHQSEAYASNIGNGGWRWEEDEPVKTRQEIARLVLAADQKRAHDDAEHDRSMKALDASRKARDAQIALLRPSWAKALIVAILEHDESDIMTDYFATSQVRAVALSWSKHTRDIFAEMRKAAELFYETAHLGPGKDVWTPRIVYAEDYDTNHGRVYAGQYADCFGNGKRFVTESEARAYIDAQGEPHDIHDGETVLRRRWDLHKDSIEHREKYSMGRGYYLKDPRYRGGWHVEKIALKYSMPDNLDLSIITGEVEEVQCVPYVAS